MGREIPAVSRAQLIEPRAAIPSQGLVARYALREQQTLDAVDMPDALRDQHLAFARDTPAILVLGARLSYHGADPRLAALEGEQGPDERLAIEPVGLRPAPTPRCGDRGGIDDVALDPLLLQCAVNPEPVEPGFLDHDDRETASCARLRLLPELRKARQQAGDVAAGNGMARHLLAATRQERCDDPARAAEFQRDEDCAKIGADGGRFRGAVSDRFHGRLQSGWSDEQPPLCQRAGRRPPAHGILFRVGWFEPS